MLIPFPQYYLFPWNIIYFTGAAHVTFIPLLFQKAPLLHNFLKKVHEKHIFLMYVK